MDDLKLLSVTTTKLKQKKKQKESLASSSLDLSSRGVTLFGGIDDILQSNPSSLRSHEPLLPSRGIPSHIFSKKKPNLPLRKRVNKLKPDKDIQKLLQAQREQGASIVVSHEEWSEEMLQPQSALHSFEGKMSRERSLVPSRRSKTSSDSERRLKAELYSLPKDISPQKNQNFSFKLRSLDDAFHGVHQFRLEDMSAERSKAISEVENYINQMPLQYVFSKPELRSYALKRACDSLFNLAKTKLTRYLSLYFHKWKKVPRKSFDLSKLNEKQIGFIVISKRLDSLLRKQLKRYFALWAFSFAAKFDSIRSKQYNDSAYLIQDWFRKMKIIQKQPFRNLNAVIRMCLYRRRAIYYAIHLEQVRRRALNKMRRGIASRRRYHFAARTIQRIIRWIFLYRHTTYRLTRQISAREIQRWLRKWRKKRSKKDCLLLELGFALGGYSRVKSRIPEKFWRPGKLLEGMNFCISTIQRWYLSRKGRLELFMKFAARRSAMEYELKRNQKALMIQNLYRSHLWNELLRAAVLNNRSRRIQRSFRAYQYRCWAHWSVSKRKQRSSQKIYFFLRKCFWLRKLSQRFHQRKVFLLCHQRRLPLLVRKIQRAYRAHVIYVAIKKEEMRIFFAAQRLKADVVMAAIRKIQLTFRNSRRPHSKLCRHVRLFALHELDRQRHDIWKLVYRIQKISRRYILKQRYLDEQKRIAAANVIWRMSKSYLLRIAIAQKVEATRKRRNDAAKKIQFNYRRIVWLRILKTRFHLMKLRIALERLQNRSAAMIQAMVRRVTAQYNTPVRIAARRQLKKKRALYRKQRMDGLQNYSARVIQKLFHGLSRWSRFCRLVKVIRFQILQNNSAKKIQKLVKAFLAVSRVARCIRERMRRNELERQRICKQNAANKIGRFWRRTKELFLLKSLFQLRRKVLDEKKRLEEERLKAEADRDDALEEVKVTEENMQATINSSWQQGSDATGRNYYYNYVTGESMWEPPPGWTLKIVDQWIRNINERGQVYYYNQLTGESRWLPPCCQCGKDAERWCTDCCLSYCVEDYQAIHGEVKASGEEGGDGEGGEDENGMSHHVWAVAELEKEVLKPGQVYCIECKKRVCTRVCLSCWDYYCDPCFKFVHHIGDLKLHETISYARAKRGWIAVKPKDKTEKIYYLNGVTGETTYEKPVELMNETERLNYENFINHRNAAEKHVKTIEKLQLELEGLKYEKDMRLAKETVNLLAQRNQKKSEETGDVLANMQKVKSGPLAFLSGLNQGYVSKLMKSDNRRRGEKRSDYIQSLLDDKDMT